MKLQHLSQLTVLTRTRPLHRQAVQKRIAKSLLNGENFLLFPTSMCYLLEHLHHGSLRPHVFNLLNALGIYRTVQ